jgi:hypothetical protein
VHDDAPARALRLALEPDRRGARHTALARPGSRHVAYAERQHREGRQAVEDEVAAREIGHQADAPGRAADDLRADVT